jgi:glycosyltransferase involved in cell wall biosynthesis
MAHEHWLVCPTHVLWRHRREICTGKQCVRCQIAYKRPPQLWRFTGFLERQLAHVDAFIAMSEFSRDKHREFGFPRAMEVLPGFLQAGATPGEPDEAPRPQERPYFLFVGRLGQLKGLQDVMPLFRTYAPADLLIAGEGDYGAALRAQAAGIERVRFLGALAAEQLTPYYRHAVALIVPSLCYETFGLIVLEAFQQRTPVIARRLGPFPELIAASGGGELFETAGELLDSMHRLHSDALHRERLAEAAHAAFRALWTEEVVLPRYLDIVRSAAVRKGDARVLAKLGDRGSTSADRLPGEARAAGSPMLSG